MYFRRKTSAGRAYLQIVESRRAGDQVRQQVIATLGRFEDLQASGQLERLLRSGARFAAKAMVLSAVADDAALKIAVRRIGPALVFERLWEETGCRAVIAELAGKRKHGFELERAVFLTVLHRLCESGSDRAADRWREDYAIVGVEGLDLHHLYRAMAWLGEELPEKEQDGRTPFAPRCLKDVVEERLFAHRRDLLTRLDLVFMDTTSLYFEGAGGQTLGQHGYSKDHRPDLRQMILAVLIDGDGRPVCSEMWPGNTADVTTLIPVVDRLRRRFDIARACGASPVSLLLEAPPASALRQQRRIVVGGTSEIAASRRKRPQYRTSIPPGALVTSGDGVDRPRGSLSVPTTMRARASNDDGDGVMTESDTVVSTASASRSKTRYTRPAIVLACVAGLGIAAALGGSIAWQEFTASARVVSPYSEAAAARPSEAAAARPVGFADVVAKVRPAVISMRAAEGTSAPDCGKQPCSGTASREAGKLCQYRPRL